MKHKKGFTLSEVIVVLVILGAAATMVVVNLFVSMEQTKAQAAKNNLLAVSAAQQKYFEDHGSYCVAGCGNSTANLNSNFYLSISDSFHYSCFAAAGSIGYNCTATDNTDTLTLNPNTAPPVSPVSCAGPNGYCPP